MYLGVYNVIYDHVFFVSSSGFGVSTIGHRWKKYLEMVPSVGTNFNKKYCTARYRDLPRSRVPPPGEHCPAPVQKQWLFNFLWFSILSQPQVWLKKLGFVAILWPRSPCQVCFLYAPCPRANPTPTPKGAMALETPKRCDIRDIWWFLETFCLNDLIKCSLKILPFNWVTLYILNYHCKQNKIEVNLSVAH